MNLSYLIPSIVIQICFRSIAYNAILNSIMAQIRLKANNPSPPQSAHPLQNLQVELYYGNLNQQIQQLQIKVGQYNRDQDRSELDFILNSLFCYPSLELAEIHENCNKLGRLDLKEEEAKKAEALNQHSKEEVKICACCGFVYQQEELKICSQSFDDVNNIGVSTYIFFRTIINVIFLLLAMLCIYSIYAFISNLTSNPDNTTSTITDASYSLDYLSISLASKYMNENGGTLFLASCWLGVVMLVAWTIMFGFMGYRLKIACIRLESQSKSVSDYSVIIQKMPSGMKIDQVQREFTRYFNELDEEDKKSIENGLKIEKYNEGTPFYFNQDQMKDDELQKIISDSKAIKNEIIEWLHQRKQNNEFKQPFAIRTKKYDEYQHIEVSKKLKYEQTIQKIKEEFKKQNKQAKTTVFVTFEDNFMRDFLLQNNKTNILTRLKLFFCGCCFNKKNRLSVVKDGVVFDSLKVYPACEPEDIVWANIGVTFWQIFRRKLLTYTVSLLLLGGSFGAVWGLSQLQNKQADRYISILISLVIGFVNLVICKVIQTLTRYERDYTVTNYQASILIKSIVAQVINTVFIPMIVNYYVKQQIYEKSGLIQDVFILSCTLNILAPALKIIDPWYIYLKLYAWYYSRPYERLHLNQFELNAARQKMEFEVGYEYIYILNSFIFTCFFVSLQPVITVMNIVGLFLYYWAQKYSLFNRCQRPVPGNHILDSTIYQILYFGGIAYVLGSLTWSNFLRDSNNIINQNNTNIFGGSLVANLVAGGIALFIFLFPFEYAYRKKLWDVKEVKQAKYQENRIFFPSEYDRLNPSTSTAGIEDYKKFIAQKREEIIGLSPEQRELLSKEFQKFGQQRNIQKNRPVNINNFSIDEANNIWANLIRNQEKNMVNPARIASVLLPEFGDKSKVMLPQSALHGNQNAVQPPSSVYYPDLSPQSAQILSGVDQNQKIAMSVSNHQPKPPTGSFFNPYGNAPEHGPVDPYYHQIFNPYSSHIKFAGQRDNNFKIVSDIDPPTPHKQNPFQILMRHKDEVNANISHERIQNQGNQGNHWVNPQTNPNFNQSNNSYNQSNPNNQTNSYNQSNNSNPNSYNQNSNANNQNQAWIFQNNQWVVNPNFNQNNSYKGRPPGSN